MGAVSGAAISVIAYVPVPFAQSGGLGGLDESCLRQVRVQADARRLPSETYDEFCRSWTTTSVGPETTSSAEQIRADAALGRRDRGELLTEAAAGKVRSKTWRIEKVGITYLEISTGRFYYDGHRAWSTVVHRGRRGSHQCQAAGSWGVGVDVQVVSCRSSGLGTVIVDRETYKVQAIAAGSPVNWTLSMSELSRADGSTTARDH